MIAKETRFRISSRGTWSLVKSLLRRKMKKGEGPSTGITEIRPLRSRGGRRGAYSPRTLGSEHINHRRHPTQMDGDRRLLETRSFGVESHGHRDAVNKAWHRSCSRAKALRAFILPSHRILGPLSAAERVGLLLVSVLSIISAWWLSAYLKT